MAKSNLEKQNAYRQRKREAGYKEIRNLWAKPEHHQVIKEFAKHIDTGKPLKFNDSKLNKGK